jgi:hypothetical protein
MSITPQKQAAIDRLLNQEVGTKRAIVGMIGCRYSGKWSHYQMYLLSDGHTAYVNLDRDPMSVYISEEKNAKAVAKQAKKDARAEKRAERKTEAKKVAKS